MRKKTQAKKGNFFHSVKGKTLVLGSLGIAAALVIGLVGIVSSNQNANYSELVSLVDEINILQAQNLANDALYQYYVDENYLDATLSNLDRMEDKAQQLKSKANASYQSMVGSILDKIGNSKNNFTEIKQYHSQRGYSNSVGKYQEFYNATADLSGSFGNLVNNNDWVEITWTDAVFGVDGEDVVVDGKHYTLVKYNKPLPVVGKRNNLIFRLGGTFTYKGDYYIKNIQLVNGADVVDVDLSTRDLAEKSGDGLGDAGIADFDGGKAIKVTGIFDADNNRWEEVSTTISVQDYDMDKYPVLKYELYLDPDVIVPDVSYKYGGAISGVYGFSSRLGDLDNMAADYSKLVVEGKDVTNNLAEIETLFGELSDNIPKYTTDPSLAEISAGFLAGKKGIFDELKAVDTKTLALKADNAELNSALNDLCASIQSKAVGDMDTVRTLVAIVIVSVLCLSIVILILMLARISIGINRSVDNFQSAIEQIAEGKISTRANALGKDEFAMFADSLNGFLDTLEGTITKVKKLTVVLADSGVALEESASKTKGVAGEINQTISEISKGAGEQAKDIETSSAQILDIRNNIQGILDNVSTLSDKSIDMNAKGKEATSTMVHLIQSSDSTNEAFGKIVEQVNKTDESVGKIQEAVSLISSVANQINLLSLNASIEAARAGEAGKGFAVVASEISQLADQTNQSTSIIEGIIKGLTEESNRTVATINEVTGLIDEQKKSIDSTSEIFENVSTGIGYTSEAVTDVLGQARSCDKSGEAVVDLMTNLSAISEENAASAETTSTAMIQLNEETARLAETAVELKKIADNLKEDLEFFEINE